MVVAAASAGVVTARSPLATPVRLGDKQLEHRMAMAAMTRLRNTPGSELPNDLVKDFYVQRASKGGLMLTEATYVRPDGRGYVRAPGASTDAQVAAWRPVTDAVHAKGGVIHLQLFHAGRVGHSDLTGGVTPVAPSPVPAAGQLYVEGGVKKDHELPRALSTQEVRQLPQDFAAAAERAIQLGGFDGVELHGGNGYLLQQFLARKTNTRSDPYGGPVANRARLLLESIDAVAAVIGAERTGVKLQPGVTFSDLVECEEDVKETLAYLAPELSRRGLAYVELSSLNGPPYHTMMGLPAPNVSFDVYKFFRQAGYGGTLMINGGLGIEDGEKYVREGVADLVSYGIHFIANANMPALVAAGVKTAGLNPGSWDMTTWYSKNPADDAKGYTDWPLAEPAKH